MGASIPLAYLITFTCYGGRLHGDEAGSVDRNHNIFGTPLLSPSRKKVRAGQKQMQQQPYKLDSLRRTTVLDSIRQHCAQRGWRLLAAHARSSHVHFVVVAAERPEKILNQVKSYASRALNRQGVDNASRRRWTHHGSTRYLWKPEEVGAAVHYVIREQGQQMAVWESSE
ncbi:MAG: transposase [Acidobacteria bacterium]|nr:transposase [Acidobacteriota bacterium]